MLDFKKIYEDAVVLPSDGGAAASEVQSTGEISNSDILGKCDHNKEGGYMKDGCFHMPFGFKHEILAGKKKKNHKNNYIKGMKTFLEWLQEEDGIANNDIYLSNMAKSFKDKAWFLKYLPDGIKMIVDFGGGAGEFVDFCRSSLGEDVKYVVIDNNPSFLSKAKDKGIECFESLQDLRNAKGKELESALLILSSVIHEIYSYKDDFYDDVGVFWTDVKKCKFKCIAIRDMSYDKNAMRKLPVDAAIWLYQKVLKSDKIEFKGKPFKEITDSFEEVWGPICDVDNKKVNCKNLFHFLIKYRYQENWAREVNENYLPVSQQKLTEWLTNFMDYSFSHKESSHLAFYDKCWTKDLKLSRPDNDGYGKQVQEWLSSLSTHIKWLLKR